MLAGGGCRDMAFVFSCVPNVERVHLLYVQSSVVQEMLIQIMQFKPTGSSVFMYRVPLPYFALAP